MRCVYIPAAPGVSTDALLNQATSRASFLLRIFINRVCTKTAAPTNQRPSLLRAQPAAVSTNGVPPGVYAYVAGFGDGRDGVTGPARDSPSHTGVRVSAMYYAREWCWFSTSRSFRLRFRSLIVFSITALVNFARQRTVDQ